MNLKATNYLYQLVDNKGIVVVDKIAETREDARTLKRELEKKYGAGSIKIVQYKGKKVIR